MRLSVSSYLFFSHLSLCLISPLHLHLLSSLFFLSLPFISCLFITPYLYFCYFTFSVFVFFFCFSSSPSFSSLLSLFVPFHLLSLIHFFFLLLFLLLPVLLFLVFSLLSLSHTLLPLLLTSFSFLPRPDPSLLLSAVFLLLLEGHTIP